jgi:hypothetical protein
MTEEKQPQMDPIALKDEQINAQKVLINELLQLVGQKEYLVAKLTGDIINLNNQINEKMPNGNDDGKEIIK